MGECRANQRAAHGETRAQFILRQPGSRRQGLLDDRLAQRPAGNIDTGGFLAHPEGSLAGQFQRNAHTIIPIGVHRMRQFWSVRSNKRQHIA